MTNNTPPATPLETPLEGLRRLIANLDCLDEDSNLQAFYLLQNSTLIDRALREAKERVQAMPVKEFRQAREYLESF